MVIKATRNNMDNRRINRTTINRKQEWVEKPLYRYFERKTGEISHEKTWTWRRKGNLKRETESLSIEDQDKVIRTNYVKGRIDKAQQNSKCWLCGDRGETINHIIRKCSKLISKRHENFTG